MVGMPVTSEPLTKVGGSDSGMEGLHGIIFCRISLIPLGSWTPLSKRAKAKPDLIKRVLLNRHIFANNERVRC
jgi:hypothetical protein